MVLDEDVDALFTGALDEVLVVVELLDGGLGEEDVDAALDGVEGDGVVAWVGREDGDGVAGLESINGGLVGVGVLSFVVRERVKGCVKAVVGLGNVLVQVLACVLLGCHGRPRLDGEIHTDGWEFGAIDANHCQVADLSAPAEVEESEPNDTNLLIRGRGSATNEAGGVLASTNLSRKCEKGI